MNKVVFLVDGFNLYHALDYNSNYHKYKWLDLSELANRYVARKDKIVDIYYFTALHWETQKVERHKRLIRALELKGVKVVYGEFKKRDKYCPLCSKYFKTREEKQTDVNIAIYLFKLAVKEIYDTAIIISGDSDLIPSISAVRNTFPSKRVGVVIPIGRHAEQLKQTCDFRMKMKEKHLSSSVFPKTINLGDDKKITCPSNWV